MAKLPAYSIFEICAGLGWLGRGVQIGLEAIGVPTHVMGCIERDAITAAGLMAGMEKEGSGVPPIWDDAETFAGRRRRRLESVDCLVAGYPCPPFSVAGKGGGFRDARNLWPACRRIIARIKPELLFLENVSGHVPNGAGKVVRDLQRLGYRVTAGLFTASEVGASHQRKRLFILGLANSVRLGSGGDVPRRRSDRGSATRRAMQRMAYPVGDNRRPRPERERTGPTGDQMGDAAGKPKRESEHSEPTEPRGNPRENGLGPGDELGDAGHVEHDEREETEVGSGLPDGDDPASNEPTPRRGGLADADSERLGGGSVHDVGREEIPDPVGGDADLGDASGGGRSNSQSRGTAKELAPGCKAMGEPEDPNGGAGNEGLQSGEGIGGSGYTNASQVLADDDGPGLESRGNAEPGRRRSFDDESGDFPLFPPGPNDYESWARLFASGLDPSQGPAIESGFSVVADGMASPGDLLRIGGNGVVSLQAAWAFINLFACAMDEVEIPELAGPLFADI